jgi:alkylation response protein AidB-like acyl-CoA dehydrogenase
MSFTDTLTEDQTAIVASVREFSEEVMAPHANEWDQTHTLPLDELRQAGELGLGAIYVGEELGGSGLDRHTTALIFEELARGDTAVAAFISIHNMTVWMIDTFASDALRAEWVPRLATMNELGSYCLTEPDAGSDAAALRTSAVRDGDEYVLTGVKQFISGAGAAAVYVVMARTGGPGASGITSFVVPADSPGLSFGPLERKMGWNAQPTRQVILDGVRVPASHRMGEEGTGFAIAMKALNGGRLNMAACSLGGAQWALERTVAYVKERTAFGKRLADIQTVMFTVADMETGLQAARGLVRAAAQAIDRGDADVAARCAMAKRFATDIAFDVANDALQLHGGYGYLAEYGIERVVRDLRVHQILEGTNQIMRLVVGRHLLGPSR